MTNLDSFVNPTMADVDRISEFAKTQVQMDIIEIINSPHFLVKGDEVNLTYHYDLLKDLYMDWDARGQLPSKFLCKAKTPRDIEKSRPYPRWAKLLRSLSPSIYD